MRDLNLRIARDTRIIEATYSDDHFRDDVDGCIIDEIVLQAVEDTHDLGGWLVDEFYSVGCGRLRIELVPPKGGNAQQLACPSLPVDTSPCDGVAKTLR